MTKVRIHDTDHVHLDDRGRSPAFFCTGKPLALDRQTVAELTAHARDTGRDVRLCLHERPTDTFHDMIIVQHKGGYYRPHRHADKGETWHVLQGEMAVFVFDEAGVVTDARVLSPEGDFLYRVGDRQYHTLVPLTDLVAYHESKPGPFGGPGDSIFAPWAPDGADADAAADYLARLLSKL